jgi:uncharacterized protein
VTVIDPVLFHDSSTRAAPILSGSRCAADGTVVFPRQDSCPRCAGRDVVAVALPGRGTVWSWTVQHITPKAPYRGDGGPFALAYVDLGDVIVQARLDVADPAAVHIGQPVRLTWLPAWTEPDGTAVLTYAFAPDGPSR